MQKRQNFLFFFASLTGTFSSASLQKLAAKSEKKLRFMGFFSLEDARASFNLFCCVYGIGTLGMPSNYSRAGPFYATFALILMAFINVYATIAVSKCLLATPNTVKTLGDLGEHCLGKIGRYITVLAHIGVCVMIPMAFLVLGSSLLTTLFPDSLSPCIWIFLMALTILPVSLTPTLKEAAGAAFAGCLGTILADFISIGIMIYYLNGKHGSIPKPHLSFDSIISCFGNLSLAYGAAIVIPAIQREHSNPSRMPRIIFVTLTLISILFMIIAVTGYAFAGCQIPGNLLFAISGTHLGFQAHRGAIVLAFLFMQLHITIAFSVILHPAFYITERQFLGMHQLEVEENKKTSNHQNINGNINQQETSLQHSQPLETVKTTSRPSSTSFHLLDQEKNLIMEDNIMPLKCIIFRITVIICMVIVACALKDDFSVFADFVGASSVSLSCIILPIIFYLKLFWSNLSLWEKVIDIIVLIICSLIALYLTITLGIELAQAPDPNIFFPFCPKEFQVVVYTNTTFHSLHRGK